MTESSSKNDFALPLSDEERKVCNAELKRLVSKAQDALKEAEEFATKYKLSFYFSPAYGMGGCFIGDKDERDEDREDGWSPSSQGC